ncbi:MAG: MBL fold metallo-hydrolase [Nitrososphaerota archaeon]|nr:MBL fold metallo-hydrolase [Nitrososphaerales archaeon]MDW8045435.1 MBL fold metallo-hydrolase [Nitrososphaerota archaeon]
MGVQRVTSNVYMIKLNPPSEFPHLPSINVYLINDEKKMIIDAGYDIVTEDLIRILKELGIDIDYIAITHIHLDHAGGVNLLLRNFPNAKVIVHERGLPHLLNPSKLWESVLSVLGESAKGYSKPTPIPIDSIIVGKEGSVFNLGDAKVRVLEAPGHSPHHLCFFDGSCIFLGDVAGIYEDGIVIPSTPPPNFDYSKSIQTIDRIINLNPKILCYAHYDFSNDPKNLILYKERLKLWLKVIAKNLNDDNERLIDKILEVDKKIESIVNKRRFEINLFIQGIVHYLRRLRNLK